MCGSHDPQAGFTLVEVLAALSLTLIILVSLNFAMTIVSRGVERAQASLSVAGALSSAATIFSADVARIAKIRRQSTDRAQGYLFSGQPNVMVYPLNEPEGRGLYLVRLRVDETQMRSQLIREHAPLPPGTAVTSDFDWVDPVVLLQGDYDISFSYRAQRSVQRSWSDEWSGQLAMPEQVQLKVADRKTARLAMPALVQPLLIDGEVECAAEGPSCAGYRTPVVKP